MAEKAADDIESAVAVEVIHRDVGLSSNATIVGSTWEAEFFAALSPARLGHRGAAGLHWTQARVCLFLLLILVEVGRSAIGIRRQSCIGFGCGRCTVDVAVACPDGDQAEHAERRCPGTKHAGIVAPVVTIRVPCTQK